MKDARSRTKRVATLGVIASLALLLSYVEFLLPPLFVAVPGIKLGLPNVAILFLLYYSGLRDAIGVSFVRVIISAVLFGSVMTLAYSAAGAVLSLLLMWLLKHINFFSITGVSVVGGISHNIGQILVAILLLGRAEIGYYLIVLTVTGTIAGALIGITASYLLKLLAKVKVN